MNYLLLVNRDNMLDRTYIPLNLVDSGSKYKDNIMVTEEVYSMFLLMKLDALIHGYVIDIMSGYRSYDYQDRLYNKLINEKGFNYAYRYIAPAGASEHQIGLAIDLCIYRDNMCFIEHEIESFDEIKWIFDNAHKYGFILRYPYNKEDITGYSYEAWHLRYVGNMASYIYYNNLTLEEYTNRVNYL